MKYKKTSLLTTAFLIALCIGIIPQIANAESFCIAQVSEEQSTNNTSQLPIIVSTPQVITTTVDIPHPPSDIPQPTNEIFQAVAESPQPTNDISQPSTISHFQNTEHRTQKAEQIMNDELRITNENSNLSACTAQAGNQQLITNNQDNSPVGSHQLPIGTEAQRHRVQSLNSGLQPAAIKHKGTKAVGNYQSPDYQITKSSNSPQPPAAIALAPKEIAEDVTTSVSKKIEAMNERLSKFKIKPRAGAYVPFGKDLKISYLGGVDIVRSLNSIVDVRLGVEYSKPGIKNGNDLEIFKVPFMLVENQNKPKLWGFKKLFYTGIGVVYMSAKYNNRQTEGVGGTFLMGRKFGNFAAEFKFDAMRKKPGYQFGGVSVYLNYTY